MRERVSWLSLLLGVACGGQILEERDSGSESSTDSPARSGTATSGAGASRGATSGTGSQFDFPVCPSSPPASGSHCPTAGQGCRYVDQSLMGTTCFAVACDDALHWQPFPQGC